MCIYIYNMHMGVSENGKKYTAMFSANYREKDWPLDLGVATHT